MNFFAFQIKSRTSQFIDTIAVIFAFFADMKRLASSLFKTLGIKDARFLGYDDRYALIINSLFYGRDALANSKGSDHRHMRDTNGPDYFFNRYPAIACQVKISHINTGMRLMTGHGRGAVIKNHQGKIRR